MCVCVCVCVCGWVGGWVGVLFKGCKGFGESECTLVGFGVWGLGASQRAQYPLII